jgi:hypothetical protein
MGITFKNTDQSFGMEFYPTVENNRGGASVTDRVPLYPSVGHGLDLRKWFDDMLARFGHYVILRRYDTTTHSVYWNTLTKEAVGGPAWEYTDYVIRSRKVIMTSAGTLSALEMPAPPGLFTVEYVTYYLKWNSVLPGITANDEIYEFVTPTSNIETGSVPKADVVECNTKYNIIETVDMLGDAGRNEYYKCICKQDVVGS